MSDVIREANVSKGKGPTVAYIKAAVCEKPTIRRYYPKEPILRPQISTIAEGSQIMVTVSEKTYVMATEEVYKKCDISLFFGQTVRQ